MRALFMCSLVLFTSAVVTSGSAIAQETENCGDVLRYASRDLTRRISFSDQRKFFYHAICDAGNSSLGIDYRQGNTAFGLNYSNQTDYCSAEKSFDQNTSYSQSDASIVVRSSLDTYLQCRALGTQGVVTRLTVPSGEVSVFQVSVHRTGGYPRSVSSIQLANTDSAECTFKGDSASTPVTQIHTDVNYNLPDAEVPWVLSCTRRGATDAQGNTTYPRVQLIVSTSQGGFPVTLPETGVAGSAWASEIRAQIAALNDRLNQAKIVSTPANTAPSNPKGFIDIGAVNEERDCPGRNQFVFGFKGASFGNQALDMWRCATIELQIPANSSEARR